MKKLFLILILAGSSFSAHAQLTGWSEFDDSSNLGLDSSGQGNNASVIGINGGAPTYSAAGYQGGSAMFNGSLDGASSVAFFQSPSM